ncbi:hypothetical protein TCEA9_08230 [Thermobrachium celere]|nr:hypothetical protein TCEA9_08230 [Thermobrachium celere]
MAIFNLFVEFIRKLFSNIYRYIFGTDEVYYIGGNDVLPPPLSNEEEKELVDRLKAGDETVKNILIERNLRLVVYIARKFENTGVGVEDLVSIGTIGLIKAVNTFDPVKKNKISNLCIKMY